MPNLSVEANIDFSKSKTQVLIWDKSAQDVGGWRGLCWLTSTGNQFIMGTAFTSKSHQNPSKALSLVAITHHSLARAGVLGSSYLIKGSCVACWPHTLSPARCFQFKFSWVPLLPGCFFFFRIQIADRTGEGTMPCKMNAYNVMWI